MNLRRLNRWVAIFTILVTLAALGLLWAPSLLPERRVVETRVLPGPSLVLMRSFLESQYVPEAGLLRAATNPSNPESRMIYISPDNLLARAALEELGSPHSYMLAMVLDTQHGGGHDYLHEVVLGYPVEIPPRSRRLVQVGNVSSEKFNTTFLVMREYRLGEPDPEWSEKPDLLAYSAVALLLEGDLQGAEELYTRLIGMWDGYGFCGSSCREAGGATRTYRTGDLALAYYLYRALLAAGSKAAYETSDVAGKWVQLLTQAQRVDGGIVATYTRVGGEIRWTGDADTFTTSLTVLSLYTEYPRIVGLKARISLMQESTEQLNMVLLALLVVLGASTALVMAKLVRARRRD